MKVQNTKQCSKQRARQRVTQLLGALALVASAGVAGASALSDAAAQLQPGQWVVLDTQNFTPALLNDGSFTVLYYSEDMTWDPVSRQILLIGGGHANDAEFLRYSEATNTWTRTKPGGGFWHGNFSHAYDHNAIAPGKGKFFHRQPAFDPSNRVEIYDIASQAWSRSAAMPTVPGCCGGLEYFPELDGLVLANGDDGVLFYDIDANSWSRISGTSWGDYHNFAEYSPVFKTMIFGGGETSGTTAIFRMNEQRQITRLGNSPQHTGITWSVVTTDPNSGLHLVFFNNTWYEFNPSTDTWRLQPGDAPWPGGIFGTVATPISTYGVVMFLNYNEGGTPRVYLYRHSPGSGTTVPGVSLSANPTSVPSGATTTLTWSSSDANSCTASGGWSGTKATSGTETSAALTANTTFTLTCANTSGGSTARSATVTIASNPAPTVNFSASPGSVAIGGSSTLNWTTSNATSCTGSGGLSGWAGAKPTTGSANVGPINAATTFTLACTGNGGTTSRNTTINLLAAPTLNFSADPTTVSAGGRSTLTWSTQNVTACAATGAWTGPKATSGSEQSPVINANSTFDLQCTGAGGTTGRSVTVNVGTTPAPTVTISASPASVGVNGTSTLTWSSTNATSCTASNGWSGTKATSGSEGTSALSNTTTYTLTCTGAGGNGNSGATVTVTPGGGGGGGSTSSGGGGAMDVLMLVFGFLLLVFQRVARPLRDRRRAIALAASILGLGAGLANAADLTTVTVVSSNSSAQTNVPVTFGHVFKPGDVPAGAVIGARAGSTIIPLQADKKATHADGSLRHAVLTAMVPSLNANGTQAINVTNTGSAPGGGAMTTAALLATTFDVTINLDVGGTAYSASARSLLQSGTPATWLSGPLATEWLLSAPVRTSAGVPHPHLQARFHVRAFEGLNTVRVEAVVENNWAFEVGPRNYTYNVTVNVAGGGTQYTQSNVNHYRQSRWRRIVWWGANPQVAVRHDSSYLQATRAVPTYDPRVTIATSAINGWQSGLGTNPGVMSIGALEPNMPSPGGRFEIAPLPAFQAGYIISQNDTARRVTIGYGEQAGAWPLHYRDRITDHPLSIDSFPTVSILGGSGVFGNFPACGGSCSTNGLLPEASHHPTLAYLPYLITGDYYLMEEMVFWGNWMLFYGESGRRGGAQGLLVWDQVRGQAWMLRTLAEAAYATPDSHPLKAYLNQKLQNNITYYRNNWVDSNPLGYITNTGAANWLGLDDWIASWMDDFLTWSFGHVVGLGFTEAQPVLAWKGKFPVGRLTDPNMCWVLASTYWPYVRGDRYAGGSSAFITNWADWRRTIIFGWNDDAFRGTNSIAGQEQNLYNAQCGSTQMRSILGIGSGEMIGWDGPDAYAANLQAATAVAVEAGVPNAQQAFNVLTSRGAYPLSAYGSTPQWAVYPATATASLPSIQISANPAAVTSGQTSTLTWSTSNAQLCTASGGWTGNKALSGSQATPAITATTTFVLTCSNASGDSSASTTVTLQTQPPPPPPPPPSAPTVDLQASATSVPVNGTTNLSWLAGNATSCTASGGWSGTKNVQGSEASPALANTTTFTLTCSGAGGTASDSVTVTVTPGGGGGGGGSNESSGGGSLEWLSLAFLALLAARRLVSLAIFRSARFAALATLSLFLAACGGEDSEQADPGPTPVPTPTGTLTANPTTVSSGASTQLTWSSTNATSCTASGGWSGAKSTSGNETISNITASTLFSLQCTGTGGTSPMANVTVNVGTPPAPTVNFAASPTNVTSGGSSDLSWTSTNATACTASGGWSGAKAANGNQTISNITSTTTYSLMCSGAGGNSPTRDATVTVNAPTAPTLTLAANPATISPNQQSVLTWNSSNATACTASGGWTGARNPNGTENVGPLTQTTDYTLTCTGTGGQVARTATVTVNGGNVSLQGSVDSSYVDRFGDNRIYVFAGAGATPDDFDGDSGDPVATIAVLQEVNACTFRYAGGNLAAGTYTIAFTQDAAVDVPGAANTLAFVGTRNVTVGAGGGVTENFRPSNILTVGPGRMHATLRAAQLAATNGAVIEIDAGNYLDDVTVWRQNNVTLRGVGGGRAHIVGNRVIPFTPGDDRNNGMGLMVVRGTGISVENIEFSGARVQDQNGAGIRNQGRDLTICNGYFHNGEDGYLGEALGFLLVEYSEFHDNGTCPSGGCNHNLYIDGGDKLVFRHNYSHHSIVGHTLKTRAAENHILYNRLMDEQTGTSSYNIDVPNGGLTFVVGNLIQQGPQTDNSFMLNYGTEGLSGGRTHELHIVNNTFVNDAGFGGFVQFQGGTSLVRTINNLFVGVGSAPGGGVVQATTNLRTDSPGLVNENGYDYRLTSTSPARDAGTAPPTARGVDLNPVYQYVHPAKRQDRPTDARIDIGAYEFVP